MTQHIETLTPICPACRQPKPMAGFVIVGGLSWCVDCVKDALAICMDSRRLSGGVPRKQTTVNRLCLCRESIYTAEGVITWGREARWKPDGGHEWRASGAALRTETVMVHRMRRR